MRADGVSEVVGAIILISLAVLAMGIVILAFFTGPLPTNVPSFSGLVTNSSKTIYITHEGGDTLSVGQFKIRVDGNDTTLNFTQSITGPFSLGKVMNATLPYWPTRVVMVFNTSWGGETVLLSADLAGKIPYVPSGWYSTSWPYRKKITIMGSQVTGSLTDFPVLIVTGSDFDLKGKAQSTGNDLVFTYSDGTTKIPYEIDNYTGTQSGSLIAWVKVPALTAGSNTNLYLYYGNSLAPIQQDPTSVWDANYRGVWHLNEPAADGGTTATYSDSTAYANTGSQNRNSRTDGKIAGAQLFNAAGSPYDYINVPDDPDLDMGDSQSFTVSAWVKSNMALGAGKWPAVVRKLNDVGLRDGYGLILFSEMSDNWYEEIYYTTSIYTAGGPSVRDNTWHYIGGTRQGSTLTAYTDGSQTGINNGASSGTLENGYPFRMGANCATPPTGLVFLGSIDEVRVSKTARPGDWFVTEYRNQVNPTGFINISDEQNPLYMY